jgi:amino acid transporter
MDQLTTSPADDADLTRFGYRQQFTRSLRQFESFAVAFSFISITTGIFTTYAFALTAGGTRSIWTWPIVIAGQALVALVYGALSSRIPLSGFSYQWASRLTGVHAGWWFGWTSFAFLTIVTVSVDYGLVQVAFQPLIGETYTPVSAALETLVVLALQAALIITSTRATTRVNNTAVATEIVGIVGLTVALLVAAAVRGIGHWSNLTSTGPVPSNGYYAWLGPFMLATLLGAYTIVGFESASNLAEETHEPHKIIPKAMVRAVLLSGVVGFVFLLVLAYATSKGAYSSSAPVAFIVGSVLGSVVQKIFLVFVCVSIFACGLVIMVTNGRLSSRWPGTGGCPATGSSARCREARAGRRGPPCWPLCWAALSSWSCSRTPTRCLPCSPPRRSCRRCCTRARSCCTSGPGAGRAASAAGNGRSSSGPWSGSPTS